MTPNITDEQRKQIEQEAEKLYPIDDPRKNMLHDNLGQYSRRDAYIIGAKKYATLCQQKDEEIARLRSALGRIEQYSDPGSYATAIVEMKVIATEALKPIIS